MNKRIVNLLRLCMKAQNKGHDIQFDNKKGSTNVWIFVGTSEGRVIKEHFLICVNTSDADERLCETEVYLRKLIEGELKIGK